MQYNGLQACNTFDPNPFYLFIQMLKYLTPHKATRKKTHLTLNDFKSYLIVPF